jgi:hypothetical protein
MPSAALLFPVSVMLTAFAHAPILDEQHGVITVAPMLEKTTPARSASLPTARQR